VNWKRFCRVLADDIKLVEELAPLLEDHASRSDGIHLPVGGTGGGGTQLDFSDPTSAAALDEKPNRRGGPNEEAGDKAVLREVRHSMRSLSRLINQDFANRASAAAAAIKDGRPITSGRNQVESAAEQEKRRATSQSDECAVCGVDTPCTLGLCNTRHYRAWDRYRTKFPGADRGEWTAGTRHKWLVDELVIRGNPYEDVFPLSVHELEDIVAGTKRLPKKRAAAEWDNGVHASIGPADGIDRRPSR
jgi:hypothetical protein